MLKGNRIVLASDVIKHIRKHWKRALIIALVITVLYAAYTYIDDVRKVKAQAAADEVAKQYNIEDFTEEELTDVQNAIDAYNLLQNTQVYHDNSFIIKADPYAVKRVVINFRVEIDSSELPADLVGQEANLAGAIRNEYVAYINKFDLGTDVAEKLKIDPQYITELISVENEGNIGFNIYLNAYDLVPDFEDSVKICLNKYAKELEENYYAHSLMVNEEYEATIRIDDYYSRQINSINQINSCTNNLANFIKKMSVEQVAYYNAETGNEAVYYDQETGEEIERYESAGMSGLLKKDIIGIIIGVIAAVLIELFIYMYSKKVVTESDFTIAMGMVLLGDNTSEDNKNVVISKIRNICKQNDIKKLALISTEEDILKTDLVDSIKETLNNNEISVSVSSDILKNADKIDEVLDASAVVLIEGVGKSVLNKVNEEAEFIEDYKLNLLGVVNCEA